MKTPKGKKAIRPEVLPPEEPESDDESDELEADAEAESDADAHEEPQALELGRLPALSPSDPLRRYMEEVGRYALLSPEEELRLARELRDTGSMDAARRLVEANLRLVVKIAMEYRSVYTQLLDLIQEGNVGLMKAVSKFDPAQGTRLGYYSSWWIRSYILKYLLDHFRLVKIGTTQAQKKLFYHLMREKQRLEAQGILAGPKLLAEKLNVREKDVVEMELRLSGGGAEVSIDAPINHDGKSTSFGELMPSDAEAADEALAKHELLSRLESQLPEFRKQLNEKEIRLLEDRILAEEPKTLQEVADLYGLTRERARQIEAKVVSKLKEFLQSSGFSEEG